GIRDLYVTGVQTCALPIYRRELRRHRAEFVLTLPQPAPHDPPGQRGQGQQEDALEHNKPPLTKRPDQLRIIPRVCRPPWRGERRSEERRVGKEWRAVRGTT